MKRLNALIRAIPAGFFISLGGTVFLSLENKILGALFFTVGLFCICTMKFNLFTGKVCYLFNNKPSYLLDLLLIWIGNLAGALLCAMLERWTRIGEGLISKAQGLAQTKLDDGLFSIFILSFFCNILIFIAVDGFTNSPHQVGKYLSLFFGVMVFILCGFEHCVANMYYFAMAGSFTLKTLLYLVIMTLGNACGGVTIPLIMKLSGKISKEKAEK